MMYPVDAPLGQPFGADPATYAAFGMEGHNGQDFPVAIGTPVRAPEDSVVFMNGNNLSDQYTGAPVDGLTIVLKGTHEHWLLHNSKLIALIGSKVKQGDIVAYSGNTGFTTGPHSHWGVRPLNPDINNGYRGFVDPLSVKENEMLDDEGAKDIYRLGLHREPENDQVWRAYVGRSLADVAKEVMRSDEWKAQDKHLTTPNTVSLTDPDGNKWRNFKKDLGL